MAINPQASRMLAQIFAPGGPHCSRETAQSCAADLHEACRKAAPIVGDITGLEDEAKRATQVQAVVVDRPHWAYGASQSLQKMSVRAVRRGYDVSEGVLNSAAVAVGTTAMARMILGQFDPYYAGFQPGHQPTVQPGVQPEVQPGGEVFSEVFSESSHLYGRLLLVAPNVFDFIQLYNLDQKDVCLWVCAHEYTHAVQYQAAPWLADTIVDYFAYILAHIDDDHVLESEEASRLIAVMSVLEGHAQYVMNTVSSSDMPSKKRIIDAMERKRQQGGALKRRLARMFGFDQKAAQYRRGDVFVRTVIDSAGRDCLNRVWRSPDAMPTRDELDHPQAWIDRINMPCCSEASSSSGTSRASAEDSGY